VKPKQACVYEIREEKDDSVFDFLRILLTTGCRRAVAKDARSCLVTKMYAAKG